MLSETWMIRHREQFETVRVTAYGSDNRRLNVPRTSSKRPLSNALCSEPFSRHPSPHMCSGPSAENPASEARLPQSHIGTPPHRQE